MNFLAHCVIADLAGRNDSERSALLAGAVLGDFVKGPVPQDWDTALQLGVRLHRRVDATSNRIEGLRRSAARFDPALRRFAPIYLDLMADHLLSLNWSAYHPQNLQEFCQRCYAALRPELTWVDSGARRFANYMIEHDLMSRYGEWQNIARAAASISRRLHREHLTEPIMETLQRERESLAADFDDYFPMLVTAGFDFVREASAAR